jgi:hypothetical protein
VCRYSSISPAACRQTLLPRVDSGTGPQGLEDIAGPVGFDGQSGGPPLPGQGPHHLPILRAQVAVGLQPAVAAVLVLGQLPLPVMSTVGLLGGHRQPTRHPSMVVAAAAHEAKHAGRLAGGGRLVGGHDLLGLLAVDGGPGQLPAAIPGGLIELAAQPVPLSPQLRRGQPLEIGAAGGVDRQRLAANPGQGLGQLHIPVRLLPIRRVQLPDTVGLWSDHCVEAGVLASSGQLHIQPVDVFYAGEPD